MTQDEAKQAVAQRAVAFVEDGMRVGLGTGTTATMFIRALAQRVEPQKTSSSAASPLPTPATRSASRSASP